MSPRKLPHYLRVHRRRAGLTQKDIAHLLGCSDGAKVSRYERFARKPSLETILAYEVIFGIPAKDLVAGIFASVYDATLSRAAELIELLEAAKPDPILARRLAFIENIDPLLVAERQSRRA